MQPLADKDEQRYDEPSKIKLNCVCMRIHVWENEFTNGFVTVRIKLRGRLRQDSNQYASAFVYV